MSAITAAEARSHLYQFIDESAESQHPITIRGERNKAVLVSEEDWPAIQETLYLLSVPGKRESIREGVDIQDLSIAATVKTRSKRPASL